MVQHPDIPRVMTVEAAAAVILRRELFCTNVVCLNLLFGMDWNCADWSFHFGGYAGHGQGGIPDDAWQAIQGVWAIVSADPRRTAA